VVNGRVGDRQLRPDKKVDVKATMSLSLKNQLYEFAELCNVPVKDISERLCINGATSSHIVDQLSKWMRRDYVYLTSLVLGDTERPKLKLTSKEETGRVSIRFKQKDYDQLCELAHALDLTPSSAVTVLIRVCTKNNAFMPGFIESLESVSKKEKYEIKRFLAATWGIYF